MSEKGKGFKLPFGGGGQKEDVKDHKLQELFQNWAGLKKQFTALKAEKEAADEELEELRKQSDGGREISLELERHMYDPTAGENVVLYCMLRGVWEHCKEELIALRDRIEGKQLEAERAKFFEQFNAQKAKRISSAKRAIEGSVAEARAADGQRQQMEATLADLKGFWNYFSRRSLMPKLEKTREEAEAANQVVEQQKQKLAEIEADTGPEFPGLSVEGKRLVNLAILALAQHLYIHWKENDLAAMAYTANTKSVYEAKFGEQDDVRFLMAQVTQVLEKMDADPDRNQKLKERMNGLRVSAEFSDDSATLPDAHCLDYVSRAARSDTALTDRAPIAANMIEKNYWDVTEVALD